MEYPILKAKQKSRQMLDTFLGYNHNLRIGENEFYEMQNMTSDDYPVLSPRQGRGVYTLDGGYASRLIAKNELCYVEGTEFVVGSDRIEMGLNDEPKQLVSMGAYVIILPDKKWINTICNKICDKSGNYEWGEIEHQKTINTNHEDGGGIIVYFHLCDADGVVYTDDKVRPGEKPVEEDGNLWLDTDTIPPVLKRYSKTNGSWMVVPKTYVKISVAGETVKIGSGFYAGDGIEISGITYKSYSNLNGFHTIVKCEEDYIVIEGMPNTVDYQDDELENGGVLTISRKMPDMDFIIESNNRLWGCYYGINSKGEFVNEIYASKLGDFKNWNCFAGISTDSYAVSCGTDGPFTGAITHSGYPLFFKENFVHKVYGDYPANFRVQSTACRGVQRGSHDSLSIVGDTLFYKSKEAVCAYDGGMPVEVSAALGNVHYYGAVACANGNKYYINMISGEDAKHHLFVFDAAKGVWHKEDNIEVTQMCAFGGEIYAITSKEYAESLSPTDPISNIVTLLGWGGSGENVNWMVQSGKIGMTQPDMKYLTKLLIRMSLDIGAEMRISIRYDSIGDWEHVFAITGTSLRSFVMPVRPRRCDHFHIRIEGKGQGKIYSITKTIEQGSDIS